MKQTENLEEKEVTVNGITFFSFCTHLRGYLIFSKKGKEISKFLLFWNRVSIDKIFSSYILIPRL